MANTVQAQLSDQQTRFREMYCSALPAVYGFLSLRVGGNTSVAEDLTAETFAAAVQKYRAGKSDEVTLSWLKTVAKRRLIDHWRRRAVASANVVVLAGRPATCGEPDLAEREAVSQALAALSEHQRAVIVLHYIVGYSVAEVGDIVGRSTKATESLLSRSRAIFRSAYMEADDG
jgi:RNA polymerase sigma-70 factor (ECF subfamily)